MDRNYSVTRFETELSIDELLSKYFDFEKTHKLCSACSGYAQTWACPPFDFWLFSFVLITLYQPLNNT